MLVQGPRLWTSLLAYYHQSLLPESLPGMRMAQGFIFSAIESVCAGWASLNEVVRG